METGREDRARLLADPMCLGYDDESLSQVAGKQEAGVLLS
jgi:hypothetical protein